MKRRRYPWVFHIAAALLLLSAVVGQWWQRQPVGEAGRVMLTIIAAHCPATVERQAGSISISISISIADSARALDGWGYARLAELVRRDGRDRCRRQRTEGE